MQETIKLICAKCGTQVDWILKTDVPHLMWCPGCKEAKDEEILEKIYEEGVVTGKYLLRKEIKDVLEI